MDSEPRYALPIEYLVRFVAPRDARFPFLTFALRVGVLLIACIWILNTPLVYQQRYCTRCNLRDEVRMIGSGPFGLTIWRTEKPGWIPKWVEQQTGHACAHQWRADYTSKTYVMPDPAISCRIRLYPWELEHIEEQPSKQAMFDSLQAAQPTFLTQFQAMLASPFPASDTPFFVKLYEWEQQFGETPSPPE